MWGCGAKGGGVAKRGCRRGGADRGMYTPLDTANVVVGTHPTGMNSCIEVNFCNKDANNPNSMIL